tara:strand:- start:587 stop:772 length:186 start_codon:yes stop_codon:yes gene_type:complete
MPVKNEYQIRKNWKFPYRGRSDPNYIKDKKKTFKQNGNGWWIYVGVASTHTPDDYKTGYDG